MRALALFGWLITGPAALAQASLDLTIRSTRPDAGGVMQVAVCPTPEAYRNDRGCIVRSVPVEGPIVHCRFEDLDATAVAVKVFHDVNSNGALDTDWLGLPEEPYGFGNDAPVRFGPPSFQAASIRLDGATQASVQLRGG